MSTFMDFITYSYMMDNIILLITGTLHQRPISELIPKCHPLGNFDQMEAIHVAATPADLYNAVLVDTPLAPFFTDCISEQDLDEMNIEIIRNTLYKAYLEAFYNKCKEIGGTTAEVMCEILGKNFLLSLVPIYLHCFFSFRSGSSGVHHHDQFVWNRTEQRGPRKAVSSLRKTLPRWISRFS